MTNTRIKGVGLGLRSPHYQYILNHQPSIPWFEALSDNYLNPGGQPLSYLEKIRQNYPITLHGVGMSLGSTDPLNLNYLTRLQALAKRIEPVYISDHLAWSSINGHYLNELLPLPYTEEMIQHLVERILQVQEFLGQRILIENPATYLKFTHSTMSEGEFLGELVKKADCYILLDLNNIYVGSVNHGFNSLEYLNAIPTERVKEIHLAGYQEKEEYIFDTHGYPVHPPVWELYAQALAILGEVPTLIEWDTDIPDFEVLMGEASKAQNILNENQTREKLTPPNSPFVRGEEKEIVMDENTIQKLFYQAVIEDTSKLNEYLKAPQNLTQKEGLGIYRGSVNGKLTRTLKSIYPVVFNLVDSQFFNATAVSFIRRFPSLSANLGDYGVQFPDFLANFPPVAKLPYLPDVARLEWYWHQVFNGEENTELNLTALGKVAPEKWGELVFYLPQNSVLLESVYPIHRIWEVNQPEYIGEGVVNLNEGGVKILLWRKGYNMRIDLPNEAEWELLKALQTRKPFADICTNTEVDVASLLPIFVQRGWVGGFSF